MVCPIDKVTFSGRSPLVICAFTPDQRIAVGFALILLERGARPGLRDNQGLSAIHYACLLEREDLLKVYLQSLGWDLHIRCRKRGNTPLHYSALTGNTNMIGMMMTFLRRYDMTADPLNRQGYTPLHIAARCGHVGAARLLLSLGADGRLRDPQDKTAEKLLVRQGLSHSANDRVKHHRNMIGNFFSEEILNQVTKETRLEHLKLSSAHVVCRVLLDHHRLSAPRQPCWRDSLRVLWEGYSAQQSATYRVTATPTAPASFADWEPEAEEDESAVSVAVTPQASHGRRRHTVPAGSGLALPRSGKKMAAPAGSRAMANRVLETRSRRLSSLV